MASGGYDISSSVSESATQGLQNASPFTVGGNSGTKWLPLALVALGAFALWLWFKNKK
jgi:hypothetical protein